MITKNLKSTRINVQLMEKLLCIQSTSRNLKKEMNSKEDRQMSSSSGLKQRAKIQREFLTLNQRSYN